MKRSAAALVVVIGLVLVIAGTASAHPLGNFTVNHYAAVELSGRDVYVHVVLDLAEIPAFQLGDRVRQPGFASALAQDLELTVDGRTAPLRVLERRVAARPGAGGLQTLRFDAVYVADGTGTRIAFRDRSFPGRIGWREITISGRDGSRVVRSSVPATSESDELRAYPGELLRSPLDVRAAEATVEPGSRPGRAPTLDRTVAPRHEGGGLEALVGHERLSAGVVLLSLALAAFWGAVHALTPGHGKALVAGYLVGTRGRPRHAVMLGATVTVTHTAGVFALGLVTLLLSRFVLPETLYPWLTLASGLLVVAVGASVLRARWRGRRLADEHHHHHDHHHDSHHDHHRDGHRHDPDGLSRRGLLGVGVAAGLLPCPSALVVLLSAIALQRVGFGLALIVAFSLGLAATITGIGLVVVLARHAFRHVSLEGPAIRALPAVSAALILVVGLAITARAVPAVL